MKATRCNLILLPSIIVGSHYVLREYELKLSKEMVLRARVAEGKLSTITRNVHCAQNRLKFHAKRADRLEWGTGSYISRREIPRNSTLLLASAMYIV
jgi:hypothetical protein